MDLQDAILVANEAALNEIEALEAKCAATVLSSRTATKQHERRNRIRKLKEAYTLLNAEFDRLEAIYEQSNVRA
jgi:hypothetical protein